jgi:phosphatidylglycerol---prolipoprotein diacylglyceryl transferase
MYPPFSPILFQLGPLSLHWYGLIMVVAIVVAGWVASRYVARHGQASSTIWDMLLWVLVPALIGERLYYVFIQSPRGPNGLGQYLANPIEILEIWRGGMHIYGAFIFGGIALALYALWKKLPLLIYFDAVALALPLGQAIGRWANFINQELYGPPTTLPWGLRIDTPHRLPPYDNLTLYPESVRFHPLFLYESLANVLGFVLIFWISRRFEKRLRNGDLFLLYLIYYPFVRFCLEFLRTDSWFFPGTPFNVVHLLSAVAIVTSLTLLIVRHRRPVAIAAQGAEGTLSVGNSETSEIDPEKTNESSAEPVEVDTGEDEHTTDKISRAKSLNAQKAEQALLAKQELETADEKDTALSANGSLEQAPDKDMETVGKQTDGMRADS